MWKFCMIAFAFVVFGSNAATAQWVSGTAVVTVANAKCINNGLDVGGTYNARYQHPNLDGNPNQGRLTLISRSGRSAHIIGKNGGFANIFQNADFAGYIGGGLVTNTSPTNPYQPQIRMTRQTPKTIDLTKTYIYMHFKIKDFFVGPGINNCNIDLDVTVLQ